MLIIEVTIGPSKIHGTGVFAAEPLKAGQVLWVFHKGYDLLFSKEELDKLPPKIYQNSIRSYIYWSTFHNKFILLADQARFYNHSEDCNCKSGYWDTLETSEQDKLKSMGLDPIEIGEGFTVAARDIAVGEELTVNYLLDFPGFKEELFPFLL